MATFTLRRLSYRRHLRDDHSSALAIILFDADGSAVAASVRRNLEGIRTAIKERDVSVVEGICEELAGVAHNADALDAYYQSRLRDASLNIFVDDGDTLDAPTLRDAIIRLNMLLTHPGAC